MKENLFLLDMFPDYEPPEEIRKALSQAAQSFFDYVTSADATDIIAKAGAVAAN